MAAGLERQHAAVFVVRVRNDLHKTACRPQSPHFQAQARRAFVLRDGRGYALVEQSGWLGRNTVERHCCLRGSSVLWRW